MKRVPLIVGLLLVTVLAHLLMAQSPSVPPRPPTKTNTVTDPRPRITASDTNNSGQAVGCCTSNNQQPSNQRSGGKTETELSVAGKQQVLAGYGRLPLSFEVNRGQSDGQVKFLSRRPGFSLFLTPSEAVLALSKPLDERNPKTLPGAPPAARRKVLTRALRIKLVGTNPAPSIDGLEELETKSNYFIGNDPTKWQTNVPNYAKVKYASAYPGVDLVYYGNEGKVEHDFIVSPGGDPSAITLGFDKREKLRFDERGDIVVKGKIGEVRLEKPLLYQEVGGVRQQVSGGYTWKGRNQIGFRVGKYDRAKTLVIDPVLSYSTYASSTLPSGGATATGIAVDSTGSAYVVGTTNSHNFPTTTGAFQTNFGSTSSNSLFVVKLNPAGSAVVYSTYLGDDIFNNGQPGNPGIAVDSTGSVYLTGGTTSASFPTTAGAFQTGNHGGSDVFVTKLNATGSALIYSTLLGGNGYDVATGVAVDSAGSAYVTGQSGSSDSSPFPATAGAFQTSGGSGACFVTKLNATGTALSYSTFLGAGAFFTVCNAIAVDSAGSAYVTGYSEGNFPTTAGAFQLARGPSAYSAFVTKLNTNGSGLVYSTFLTGNSNGDVPGGIAVDSAGSAYVSGLIGAPDTTFPPSSSFPTTSGAFQTTFTGSSSDVFATKLAADGSGVIYSTYLGDSGEPGVFDIPLPSIAVDSVGSAIVTGATSKTSFPTTSDAFQKTYPGLYQAAFVTKLSADGSGLVYSTYLGGHGQAQGMGIAVDSAGSAYVTGPANSNDFPTTAGAVYPVDNSCCTSSGFVAKFDFSQPSVSLSPTSLSFPETAVGQSSVAQTVTFSAIGSGALAFSNIMITGTNTGDFAITSNGCSGATLAANTANSSCQEMVAFTPTATGQLSAVLQFTDDVSGSPQSVPLSGTGLSQSTTTTLTPSLNPTVFGQSVTFTATVSPVGPATRAAITGTVMFYDGAVSLGSSNAMKTVGSAVQALFSTSSLSVGTHSITAIYSGDANYNSSASLAFSQTVSQASTTTTLAAVPNPSSFGQAVILTATITVAPPGAGLPTGTAAFFDGTTNLGAVALNDGAIATFITSLLVSGSHNLTASYGGDTNFIGSNTASALILTVQAPPPPVQIVDNETISVNDAVSFQDIVDAEAVHVTDAVFVTPLINVTAPVADYSTGSLGFGNVAAGQTGTQALTVSDIGQAPLTLSSAVISQGSAFMISQTACSNGATSLPTTLPVGGVCTFMVTYTASASGTGSATLLFADNAALSNVASVPSGSNYTQSISLNGTGTTTPPPPTPPAIIPVLDNEVISVTDIVSFSDVVDAEAVHVIDTITLTVLNTPTGTNVTVTPVDATTGSTPVTVTYASVTQPGITSLTTTSSGPAPPTGFQPASPAVYYNLSTTATFTGTVAVCINYIGVSFNASPQLFQYSGSAWANVTTSVSTINHVICGITTSLSPFAIFQPTTQPAAITSASSATFTASSAGSFTVNVTGLPTPALSESGGLPAGLSFNASTGVLSGTPAAGTGGAYNITFTATNGVGTAATQNFTLTVDEAPAITSANSATLTFGTSGTFIVGAIGFPKPTFNETGALPTGLIFTSSTGVLSGTPALGTVGTYTITFMASNGVGIAATQTFALTVSKANQAITLTGVPSSAVFGQGPFTLSASATSGLSVTLSATANCSLLSNSLILGGVGTCSVTATQSGSANYNAAPTLNQSFTIGQAPTATSVGVSPATVQYSDYTTLTATVSPVSAGGQSLAGSVQFYLNDGTVGPPVLINSSGVATLTQLQVKLSAGSYTVKAVFSSTNANFAGSSATTTRSVAQEDAFILYSGDTIAQVGTPLNLRATVWDSAATGYPGANPETGSSATIGDITQIWVAFDIFPAGTCGGGAPSTLYARVALTGTPGIGIATTALNSASEVSYCVVSRLVAGNTGGTNQYYTAPDAEAAGLDFYVNTGQFAGGGGWVNDPSGSHGNFGFNARYNSTGSPKGQMVYVYRGLYNGVLADFIIKSNALNALQFTGTTYPVSATLQGKANVQVNRASDGLSLFSAGNYTFSATVTDSGQNGATGKQFSLTVYTSNGVPYHQVASNTPLQGGNVVVHSH